MAQCSEQTRDHSPSGDRPNMSDLRIVLVGRNASENNRVGNFILNKEVFGKKSSHDVEEHREIVEGRNITVISTTHLLESTLSPSQITQKVSAVCPEPYVIILVLQHDDFSKKDRKRPSSVLSCFGEQAMKITMILTTDDETRKKSENERIQQITEECGGRRLQLQNTQHSQILQNVDEIICEFKKTKQGSSVTQEDRRQKETEEENTSRKPDVRDLRIVLLGKSVSETSRVGNFILGKDVFESESPLDKWNLQPCSQRVRGRLKDRLVTVINSPQLLQTHFSEHQITQTVRECVSLSDPGPHVFILVLQYKDFTEEDMRRVKQVLEKFSEEAIKRTIVITTDEESYISWSPYFKNKSIHELIQECGGGHLQLDKRNPEWQSEIFKSVDKILQENQKDCLTCDIFHDVKETSVDEEKSRSEEENKELYQENKKERQKERSDEGIEEAVEQQERTSVLSENVSEKQKLNLVLCGSDGSLTVSVSKLLQGKTFNPSHQRANSEECVKIEERIHDRPISLVELPAVNHLSEEEVMRQTLRCVSLCDPGVHVFLLIIPDAPLTDEDKAEMEKIHRIFGSSIKNHLLVLIIQEKSLISIKSHNTSATETSPQTLGGHRFVLENSSQVPALLQDVENMVEENRGSFYTTFMYLQARVELEKNKHRAEIGELRRSMMKTAGLTHSDDDDDTGVRIVLMGKTGVGKSATGNTILRKTAFKSKLASGSLTRECQKETAEFNRRRITVIDTPGLFDTEVDYVETGKEIVKCVSMAAPGPHVFLLVIQLGRFTQEEKDAVKMIQETFGDQSRMYTMVLFTRGDDLTGTTIQEFIEANGSLKNIVQQCGKRYHVFNNKQTEDQTQVSELLEKIDRMVAVNGGSFYTNEMFQMVEKNIKEEQERILKEKEEEIKRKEEALKTKYESEIEQMKKEKEREIQEMHNELRKREEEFKKKEEEIKKEKDENLQKEMQRKLEEQKKQLEDENKTKEKALGEQQKNIKYLEEKHEKEKQNLLEKIQRESREQAERDLARKVSKALDEAEAKVPYRSKRARDWGYYVPVAGAAAGGLVGGVEDIVNWFHN